jgi:hypothetical protein
MTAIEWLMLEKALVGYIDDEMVEQAKEIEKQQIIEAHGIKTTRGERQGISFWERKTGEQYYNETYKKNNL